MRRFISGKTDQIDKLFQYSSKQTDLLRRVHFKSVVLRNNCMKWEEENIIDVNDVGVYWKKNSNKKHLNKYNRKKSPTITCSNSLSDYIKPSSLLWYSFHGSDIFSMWLF